MSLPIRIPDHAAQSASHLTEAFASAPVTVALAKAFGNATQRLEDAAFQVLYSGLIGKSTVLFPKTEPDPTTGAVDLVGAVLGTIVLDGNGASLDQLGSLLACPRGGLTDADYLVLLKCSIIVYRSKGKTKDIQALLAAATPLGSTWSYDMALPIGLVVRVYGPAGPAPIATYLRKAAPSGVPIFFETNASSLSTTEFFSSSYGTASTPGLTTWGSAYGAVSGAGTYSNTTRL